ncbi:MAG: MBL fold metallo-hydrolase [Candidatus Dormibacteraceae bacterium]
MRRARRPAVPWTKPGSAWSGAAPVAWERGISLVGHDLWLDPQVVRGRAFVSHAHTDHARPHHHAFLTRPTLELLTLPRQPRQATVLEFGVPVDLPDATVTLFDAGHMLGSAQLLFEHQGWRLLYSGDLKVRRLNCVRTAIPRADVLVLESTYGRPHFRFPDPAQVLDAIVAWIRRSQAEGVVPVLLANALGKAQELMITLGPLGFRFALEERCVPVAEAYARAGTPLPGWIPLEAGPIEDRVVIAPPAGKDAVRRLPRHRTALVSGWAQDPFFWPRFGADRAFPLSDHCDFTELWEVVERSGAEQVYTVHGFTEDLAADLRRRGVRAHPLAVTEQLGLALDC